jgi:hypothetical protein
MGGDGFQGIVLVEVNVDPYPAPILQNPGNQNFVAGGQFIINQTVSGIADVTWKLTQIYSAPSLANPGNQSFGATGGTFTVTNTVNSYLVGPLVWTVTPSSGIILQSNTSSSATFYVNSPLSAVPTIVTATGGGGSGSTSTFTITCTSYPGNISSNPATNAAQVLVYYPTAPDGLYWINCGGTSTQVYCIMNSIYDGGGWMLLMKATRGTTFSFNSTYFTDNTTTLNTSDLTLNDGDAKYSAFNSVTIKDVMALWPDVGYTGGSISGTPYWTWLVDNWYSSGTRITAFNGLSTTNSRDSPSYPDPNTFPGNSTNIWSEQSGARRHVFGGGSHVSANQPIRWGFLYNNENDFNSIDVTGGIGMSLGNESAGDYIGCCQSSTGLNRTMRVLFFGR